MTQLVIHSKDKCVFMIHRSVIYNSFLRHKQNTSMLSRKHRLAKAHLNESPWQMVLCPREWEKAEYGLQGIPVCVILCSLAVCFGKMKQYWRRIWGLTDGILFWSLNYLIQEGKGKLCFSFLIILTLCWIKSLMMSVLNSLVTSIIIH